MLTAHAESKMAAPMAIAWEPDGFYLPVIILDFTNFMGRFFASGSISLLYVSFVRILYGISRLLSHFDCLTNIVLVLPAITVSVVWPLHDHAVGRILA